jgi:dolichyl-phosphate-mannose--protein O-mannosyl transferase
MAWPYLRRCERAIENSRIPATTALCPRSYWSCFASQSRFILLNAVLISLESAKHCLSLIRSALLTKLLAQPV